MVLLVVVVVVEVTQAVVEVGAMPAAHAVVVVIDNHNLHVDISRRESMGSPRHR